MVESGAAPTHIVPIYEGYSLPHAIIGKNLVGGCHLDLYFMKLMAEKGYKCETTADRDIFKKMKESVCYTALDFDTEMESMENPDNIISYELPDGRKISLGSERFKCPELIFSPNLDNIEVAGLHEHVVNSIRKCDPDLKTSMLFPNIILSGGSTLFPNIEKRLKKEIMSFSAPGEAQKTCVEAPPNRLHSAWIGGAILSGLSTFENMWISKTEYDDYGPGIVHKKCF